MKDPVLNIARWSEGRGHGYRMVVHGGLHYIKGNSKPYFSLTSIIYKNGHDWGGGCNHEEILKRFPKYADLAALHLSDIDGVPAVENGFYFLAGADILGTFKWANDKVHGPAFDWAARTLRISEDEARKLVGDLFGNHFSLTGGFLSKGARAEAKARFAAWVETQKPRWKKEANDCIARHGLVIYGDGFVTYEVAS